jgi:large subunit ribosomal protein L22
MKAIARAKFVRVTPRKARAVADLVRGKSVLDALRTLDFTRRAAAIPVAKTIRSAAANVRSAEGGEEIDFSDLTLETICVDEGPSQKRWRPASRGQMHPYKRRTSHITVTVTTRS